MSQMARKVIQSARVELVIEKGLVIGVRIKRANLFNESARRQDADCQQLPWTQGV